MKRHLKKSMAVILLLVIAWLAFVGSSIYRFGYKDRAAKADCIIVLGAAAYGNQPSPVFEERIRHAITLFASGYASMVIFTGGISNGSSHAESKVAATYAIQRGVPAIAIRTETISRTTQQNLAEARKIMRSQGLHSAVIVSDPLHLRRAVMMADDLGIKSFPSATQTSRYQSLKSNLGFLFREMYFYHHYLLTGD